MVADVEQHVDAGEDLRRRDVVAQVGALERVGHVAGIGHVGREDLVALVVEASGDGAPEPSRRTGDEDVRSGGVGSGRGHRSISVTRMQVGS